MVCLGIIVPIIQFILINWLEESPHWKFLQGQMHDALCLDLYHNVSQLVTLLLLFLFFFLFLSEILRVDEILYTQHALGMKLTMKLKER